MEKEKGEEKEREMGKKGKREGDRREEGEEQGGYFTPLLVEA